MIRNIRHTGIVVRNHEKAVPFYEGMGFLMLKREMEKGPYIDMVVGLKNVKVETAKLKSPCGAVLELLQYHSHPSDKKIRNQQSNDLGCSHIAITVDDIDKCLNYIQECGGSTASALSSPVADGVRVAYCHDPEGVLIEVVEEI